MFGNRKILVLSLLSLALFVLSATASNEPERGTVRLDGDIQLHANGDGFARVIIDFAPADYTRIKSQNPNAHRFLRDFTSRRANFEVRDDAVSRYDDAKSAVVLELTEQGTMRNTGAGRWKLQIARGSDFVNLATAADGCITAYFFETGRWPGGIAYKGQVRYRLPAGATDAKWDAGRRLLEYTLAGGADEGPASLEADLQVKQRLMSAIYKVYGLGTDFSAQWIAKAVLRNTGRSTLRDLRIRYRLSGYAEWCPWQKFPEMVPGQTIVSNYYPVLDESIARLSSNTPANLLVEWRYTDADGQVHTETDGRRLILLGAHEFVFSNMLSGETSGTWQESTNNAPFIVAWCSRDDLVVKQFASMASRAAGGAGTSRSDAAAKLVLKKIYDLWLHNNFSYQSPPALRDSSIRFDVRSVQNVKFPRDVIRDRSGTCLDLAILYAAMANAVGIDAYLVVIPGHCFPVFRLPSGALFAVEATGVRGGLEHNVAKSFKHVSDLGAKILQKYMRDGRIHMLNVQKLWTRGISNPELPGLPANILQQWGITELGGARRPAPQMQPQPQNRVNPGNVPQNRTPQVPVAPDRQPVTPPPPPPPPVQPNLSGAWRGRVTQQLATGQVITYPVEFALRGANGRYAVTGRARARVSYGCSYCDVEIAEAGTATAQAGRVVFQFQWKTMTNLATGCRERRPVDRGVLAVSGNRMTGRIGNDTDGWVQVDLVRC